MAIVNLLPKERLLDPALVGRVFYARVLYHEFRQAAVGIFEES
jgi:hypothetical protein